MPQNRIGVLLWTDGGNSTLTRDPRDLTKPNPIEGMNPWRGSAGGMATLYMLIDAKDGTPLSGTFVRSHATFRAVDTWGRVYIPYCGDGNPFGVPDTAGAGLLVLQPDLLRPELQIRLGGKGGETGQEALGYLAIQNEFLVMGGTTCARGLKTVNPVQPAHGGGQDGFLVILKLWDL
jgi:hypothetical protein